MKVFFDFETSPLVGYFFGIRKQFISPDFIQEHSKIICVSFCIDDGEVKTLKWDAKKRCDKKLVKDFSKIVLKSTEMIAHYGDGFDMPVLRARALFWGIVLPYEIITTDTYKWSKRLHLPSRKLNEIGRYYGLGEKISTSANLWVGCMKGDKQALTDMCLYCEVDVELLRKVYLLFLPHMKTKVHRGQENWTCPDCGSYKVQYQRKRYSAAHVPRHCIKCTECKTYYTLSTKAWSDKLQYDMDNKYI